MQQLKFKLSLLNITKNSKGMSYFAMELINNNWQIIGMRRWLGQKRPFISCISVFFAGAIKWHCIMKHDEGKSFSP